MNGKVELAYPNKEPQEKILAQKPCIIRKEVKSYGNLRLDGWINKLILGDNLLALRSLYSDTSINGHIRVIYIDPPFATKQIFKSGIDRVSTISRSNNDRKVYEDILIGVDYLEFLRKRLIFLRELLADNGSIYIHIDYKIGHYVKILMDEIFGSERFINEISRIKCNPKNFKRKGYGNIKDMILFYSKTDKYIWNDPREDLTQEDLKRLFPKIDKDGIRYTTTPLHAPGETLNGPTGKPWRGLEPPKGRHWRCSPEEMDKLDKQGLIEWSSTGNPRKKIYAHEIILRGKKRQDIWEFKDHPYPSYPTEKNKEMLRMIIETSSNIDDIVLDCFAGSGSTLIAAEETGRRWIGIDNSKFAIDVSMKRLKSLYNLSEFVNYEIEENRPDCELNEYAVG